MSRIIAITIAAVLGAAAGGLAVRLLPAERFAWTGLALVPLFVLIETRLGRVVPAFGDTQTARLSLAGTVVACFYLAWFALRPA